METKRVFSDDVIQRITSGNEPTQTKISLDVLKDVLNPKQMRNVLGGSGGDGYPTVQCLCTGGITYYGLCAYSNCPDCMIRTCASSEDILCYPVFCWD